MKSKNKNVAEYCCFFPSVCGSLAAGGKVSFYIAH